MPSSIGKGLLNGEFSCHYQAVVAGNNQKIFYYEALVRKKDHDELLNFNAIHSKKILAHLSQEVFWQTSKKFSDNKKTFAINLPPKAVLDKHTFKMIEAMIRNTNMGERMILEIVGSDWMEYKKRIKPLIRKLKDIGVRFALDGIGPGVLSFDSIEQLEIDIVKIDGMLFKNWIEPKWGEKIVELVVEHAHKNNLTTIAKEIDSKYAFNRAYSYGVDCVQGFYIHYPSTMEL
jgi:EAL domain-containing protein (putative c-di-GMP-specific phosphodiesterase class I)